MNDPGTDDLAARLLLLSALEKRVAELRAQVKRELHQRISPGTSLRPVIPGSGDERPVGRVTYTINRTTASVTDEEAFADWATRHYSQGVSLVYVVADWLKAAVIKNSEEAGVPVGPGGECGPDGPAGVTVREAGGYITAVPDKERTPELWAAIRDRLPELTATP